MRLRTQMLTKNDCYKANKTIKVKGVMVHSTGANNPKVSRYVPGDSEIGKNALGNHWDQPGIKKCVHAFVGKFADGKVGTVQTLPWNRKGWHGGIGKKGSVNDTHIGFEICEDGLTDSVYFKAAYQEAAELTAMLCKEYKLDPLADGVVICHQEGYRRGVASNHGDVFNWFPKHGKSMDDFRQDVARIMKGPDSPPKETETIEEDDEMLTYSQWKEYMDQYRAELAAQGEPDWAALTGEWEKAFQAGIIADKTRPQDFATRAETAAMILRSK